jgi:DNA-binding response OmpR family regulator
MLRPDRMRARTAFRLLLLGRCVLPRHTGRAPTRSHTRAANARRPAAGDTEIDTTITSGPGGRAEVPGSPPTWLVLADAGRPVVGDGSSGVAIVAVGSAFVRLLQELRPTIAVVSSPPAAPSELLAAVAERRQRPAMRLIFLNEPDDVAGRLEALALGFDAALPMSVDPAELAGRAQLLIDSGRRGSDADRRIPIGQDVLLDLIGRRVRQHGIEVHLRPKEFALLAMLASDPGRAFSRAELVDRIWGRTYAGGARTVDVHIRWLRAKIEHDPARPVHLITVRGTGYRLDPPDA